MVAEGVYRDSRRVLQSVSRVTPEWDIRLVDGETLLDMMDNLENFEIFARHFDDMQVADGDTSIQPTDNSGGLIDRLRGLF